MLLRPDRETLVMYNKSELSKYKINADASAIVVQLLQLSIHHSVSTDQFIEIASMMIYDSP